MDKDKTIEKLQERRERLKNRYIQEVVNKSNELQVELRDIEEQLKELNKEEK